MKRGVAFALAVLSAACAASSGPRLGPPVAISESQPSSIAAAGLIGLSIPEIRERLGGGALAGEFGPSIAMLADDGPADGSDVMSFLTLGEALGDPVMQAAAARGVRGFPRKGDWSNCRIEMSRTQYGHGALLVLRNGRVSEVRQPDLQPMSPDTRPAPRPGEKPMDTYRRLAAEARERPVQSYLLSAPGRLPLAEGPAFVENWRGGPALPDDVITATCGRYRQGDPVSPPPQAAQGFKGLSASDMQALALVPFAVALPFINADRKEALVEGPKTMALLSLGAPVPEGPETFERKHERAFWYPGPDDYGILVFDLGMLANNNLTARGAYGYAGVRAGKVVWVARQMTGGIGMNGNLLCLDERNISANTRKGCTGYGQLKPKK